MTEHRANRELQGLPGFTTSRHLEHQAGRYWSAPKHAPWRLKSGCGHVIEPGAEHRLLTREDGATAVVCAGCYASSRAAELEDQGLGPRP